MLESPRYPDCGYMEPWGHLPTRGTGISRIPAHHPCPSLAQDTPTAPMSPGFCALLPAQLEGRARSGGHHLSLPHNRAFAQRFYLRSPLSIFTKHDVENWSHLSPKAVFLHTVFFHPHLARESKHRHAFPQLMAALFSPLQPIYLQHFVNKSV